MRQKLSPKLIEHLKSPGPKRMDVWDTVLQCFGLRISPTGRKAWFVVVRLDGRQKRVTIGTYPAISLAEARAEARKIIRDAQLGVGWSWSEYKKPQYEEPRPYEGDAKRIRLLGIDPDAKQRTPAGKKESVVRIMIG